VCLPYGGGGKGRPHVGKGRRLGFKRKKISVFEGKTSRGIDMSNNHHVAGACEEEEGDATGGVLGV